MTNSRIPSASIIIPVYQGGEDFRCCLESVVRLNPPPCEVIVVADGKAYPVYSSGYQSDVQIIQDYLDTIENLHSVGRNGMHRYNNMDHSMLSAMLAVQNILGGNHNQWNINTDLVYYEEHGKAQSASSSATEENCDPRSPCFVAVFGCFRRGANGSASFLE